MTVLGSVVRPIVDVVDVDGIVQKIDFNDLLERVDINELLQRIDFDPILDSVDINQLLDRIDWNKVLQKVDLPELMERAEIPELIARTTGDVFSPFLNSLRSQMVLCDLLFQGDGCVRRRGLPPRPGKPNQQHQPVPKGTGRISLAVQGRTAGNFPRIVAFAIDLLISTSLFVLILVLLETIIEFARGSSFDIQEQWGKLAIVIAQQTWFFIYFATAIAASSQTFGKMLLGLRVVNNEDGSPVDVRRVIVRTLFVCLDVGSFYAFITFELPFLSLILWGALELLSGLLRRDRRQLHDLISGSCVVYQWDARLAQYRQDLQDEEFETLMNGSPHTFSSAREDNTKLPSPEGSSNVVRRRRRRIRFWRKEALFNSTQSGDSKNDARQVDAIDL